MSEYKILWAFSAKELSEQVTKCLNQKWWTVGGVHVAVSGFGHAQYSQAVCRMNEDVAGLVGAE